jgi:hypothetical protein
MSAWSSAANHTAGAGTSGDLPSPCTARHLGNSRRSSTEISRLSNTSEKFIQVFIAGFRYCCRKCGLAAFFAADANLKMVVMRATSAGWWVARPPVCGKCARAFSSHSHLLAGHNKWSKVKHIKASKDVKRRTLRSGVAHDLTLYSRCMSRSLQPQ